MVIHQLIALIIQIRNIYQNNFIMKKILLTGGSGYIGSHTLLELAKSKKYKLAVFDNFKNGHLFL